MFAVCATFVAGNAKASEPTTPPAITMVKGASARVGGDKVNGLRFIAGMSNEDYGWFANNVGEEKAYASVKFGMVIAPANYLVAGKEFTEANLFGESAIYDWATYQDGEWVYNGKNGEVVDGVKTPVRIINIVADEMSTYIDDPNLMVVTGAIKDYQEYNIVRDFVGRGYYQLFDGEGKLAKTVLASYAGNDLDNNTRSMIEVVQSSIENDVLEEDQLKSAKETYLDTIADNLTVKNYKVEVMLNKTVAGNEYNGADTQADVSTVIYTSESEAKNKTEFKLNSWKSSSDAMEVVDGIVTGKVCGFGYWITSELFPNLAIAGEVYTPIASRADLDALGFDYREDQNADKWAYGMRYRLTNDIDYASDTSTYGTFRMNDANGTQDLWDRYLIPIAASVDGGLMMGAGFSNGGLEWGVFGELGRDGLRFQAILDGNGYAIKNAVIPYGTVFCYGKGVNTIINNNFIGGMYGGAQLKNIAFTGLTFENPGHIANTANPYYTDANANNDGKKLQANGYITGSSVFNYTYGSTGAMNASNRAGIVGTIFNSIIENVYAEAEMNNGTYGNGENGLIVAMIETDLDTNEKAPGAGGYVEGTYYRNTPSKVKNCITVATQGFSNVGYSAGDSNYNSGMGAIVGKSNSATAVENCFTIASYSVYDVTGGGQTLSTIFCHNTSNAPASVTQSINSGVYSSVASLQSEQASVLANMSIAKYLV